MRTGITLNISAADRVRLDDHAPDQCRHGRSRRDQRPVRRAENAIA
jgi:hypothetical protein